MNPLSFFPFAVKTSHIMKEVIKMILFTLLMIIVAVVGIALTLVIIVAGAGVGLIIADVAICIFIIYLIIKAIAHL